MGEQAQLMIDALILAGGDEDLAQAMIEDPESELYGSDVPGRYWLVDDQEAESEDGADPITSGDTMAELWESILFLEGMRAIGGESSRVVIRDEGRTLQLAPGYSIVEMTELEEG